MWKNQYGLMAGTDECFSRVILFVIGLFLMAFCHSFNAQAQVVIEEELKIEAKENSFSKNKSLSGNSIGTQSHGYWEWYQHVFKPQRDGELKISLINAEHYLQPIDTTAYFKIEIWGKNGRRDTTVKSKPILGEPIVGSIFWTTDRDWFLYGKGPFKYAVTLEKDATVRLWHDYSSEFLGWECDPFCHRIVEYTYEGKRTDENLGNYTNIVASSFDWGQQYDFPEGKYLSKYRSFFELDVSGFEFPLEFIDSSILELMARGNNVDPDSKEGYQWQLEEVSEYWEENTITWDNQPPVSDRKIVLKNPPRQGFVGFYKLYDLDVQNMVKDWITNPNSIHGLRLSLVDEEVSEEDSWDRFIAIPGSDGDWSLGKPKLTINFSNLNYQPTTYSISAGKVGKGDTVLVAFKNRDSYWNSKGNFIHEDMVDGEKFGGRQFNYENWKGSGDPIGRRHPGYLNAFVYVGEKESDEILLGDTKYYAAQWKDPAKKDKITIEEVETDGNGEPIKPSGLIPGAFESNPIEVVSGGKSGIYWEQQWATVNSDGSISSGNLPSGMIRVVGRYWEEGKDHKVKLKAEAAGGNGELEIKVVKPDRLGDKYGKARDVFNEVVDMDSVIIANAGKYGIPPQWIKGQMQKETDPIGFNFPEGNEEGFPPAYRYEPFNWEFIMRDIEDINGNSYEDNPFWVTESSMGVNIPPAHKNIIYKPYPQEPLTVWNMVNKYSHLTNNSNFAIYGKHLPSGKMDFEVYGYSNIQQIYDEIKNTFRENYSGDTLYAKARDSTAIFLKTKWKGPEERQPAKFEGGLENLYAQTRTASSYGLMQMMYHNATKKGYDITNNNAPEYLNEVNTFFPFAMDFHLENLGKVVGKSNITNSNWAEGFEQILMRLLNKWNSYRDSYEQDIAKFSLEFKPEDNR